MVKHDLESWAGGWETVFIEDVELKSGLYVYLISFTRNVETESKEICNKTWYEPASYETQVVYITDWEIDDEIYLYKNKNEEEPLEFPINSLSDEDYRELMELVKENSENFKVGEFL